MANLVREFSYSEQKICPRLTWYSQDFSYAAIHRTFPRFPLVPRKPILADYKYRAISKRITPEFGSISSELLGSTYGPFLDPTQVETYTELSIVLAFRESCIGNESELELVETDFFDAIWLRAQHSLISFYSSNMFRQDSDVQSICRIVVPIFIVHTQLVTYRHSPASESLKDYFLGAIASLDLQKLWEHFHELMVWAFMWVCYSCSQQVWRERFLLEMAKGGRGRMTWEWQEVRKILHGFFFVDRLQGEEFRKICEEIRFLDESMNPAKAEE